MSRETRSSYDPFVDPPPHLTPEGGYRAAARMPAAMTIGEAHAILAARLAGGFCVGFQSWRHVRAGTAQVGVEFTVWDTVRRELYSHPTLAGAVAAAVGGPAPLSAADAALAAVPRDGVGQADSVEGVPLLDDGSPVILDDYPPPAA